MAENTTESESPKRMELLDLNDDALIHILSYLDHFSQLKAMLVCRRFELLMGQNAQFYSNYKLNMVKPRTHMTAMAKKTGIVYINTGLKAEKFLYFGRYFGEVSLSNYFFGYSSICFPSLMQTFEIIGPKIIKLVIKQSDGCKNPFLDVLKCANNVHELSIQNIKLNTHLNKSKYKEVDIQQFTFPDLKSLELISIRNFEIFEEIFHPVAFLQHLKFGGVARQEWQMYQQILSRQEDLRSLELNRVVVGDDFEWRNWNIQKLTLRTVYFPNKQAFEKFADFAKTLSNIQELKLDVMDDEGKNNYTQVLIHLLNLPSLRILELNCAQRFNLMIKNPSVRTYIVGHSDSSFPEAAKRFPNIQTVEVIKQGGDIEIISVLTSLKFLSELKLPLVSVDQLRQLKCSKLRKLSAKTPRYESYEPEYSPWKVIGEDNPNIEFLELWGRNENWFYSKIDCRHIIYILHFLPKLKILKMPYVVFDIRQQQHNEKAFNMIATKFINGDLEYIEMYTDLEMYDAREVAVDYFKSKFPQLRCESRMLDHENSRITIRK